MLVPTEEDLEDIADKYYATTMPVEAMANNLKRNMLYWYYATEVYHVRGWLDRKPLPTCLVFCIRFIYPNDKVNDMLDSSLVIKMKRKKKRKMHNHYLNTCR